MVRKVFCARKRSDFQGLNFTQDIQCHLCTGSMTRASQSQPGPLVPGESRRHPPSLSVAFFSEIKNEFLIKTKLKRRLRKVRYSSLSFFL